MSQDYGRTDMKAQAIGWRTWSVVLVASFVFMSQTFATVAAGSVEIFILQELGQPSVAGWIVQGPLLIQAVLAPIVGRLSDVVDRKWLATIPPLIGVLGSVVAATAKKMGILVAGNIFIGVAISTIAIIQAIPAEVLPRKRRVIANGATFIGGALGTLAGSIISGAVTNFTEGSWRDIFWIQGALHLSSFIGLLAVYHPKKPAAARLSGGTIVWMCDPIGCLLFMVGSANLLLALDWAGTSFPWDHPQVLVPLIAGALLIGGFALYEWKARDDGLIAHAFFRDGRNFALACTALVVEGWIFYSAVNNLMPQIILNLGFATDPWQVAICQLASSVPTLLLAILVAWYSTKFRDLKLPLIIGYIIFLGATIGFTVLTPEMNEAQVGLSVLVSVGQASPLLLLVALVQIASPHKFLATASGLAFSARAIGGAFGSAILGAIVSGRLASTLPQQVSDAALKAGFVEDKIPQLIQAVISRVPGALLQVPDTTPKITDAVTTASEWAYARAYNVAWASIIPFIVVALVAVGCLRGVEDKMTETVEATVEKGNLKRTGSGGS